MCDVATSEQHPEHLSDVVICDHGMKLAPLLCGVAQHLCAEEDIPAHLGVELHDLFRGIIASSNEVVEAEAEMRISEL